MQKIATFLRPFLKLRPNCLLTRKPIRIESSTQVGALKQGLYRWQIKRHGYKIASLNELTVHVINVDQIQFSNLLDHLISCAEIDYLE